MRNYPALKAVVVLISGIVAGRFFPMPVVHLFLVLGILLLLSLFFLAVKQSGRLIGIFIIISIFFTGVLRYQIANRYFPANHILQYIPSSNGVSVRGHLVKDPIPKSRRIDFEVETTELNRNDTIFAVCGKMLIPFYDEWPQGFQYGDEILVTGKLERPRSRRNPGGFDYRAYLGRKSIFGIFKVSKHVPVRKTGRIKGNPILRKGVYPVRRYVTDVIGRMNRGEGAYFLQALLVGERGMITPDVRDDFARAGVIHVLAVSGLHVGFVLLIFMTLFGFFRFPYALKVVLTVLGLIFFTLLTEARPPVVRASIMASFYLLGTLIERKIIPLNIIGVAALGMLLLRPRDLFDVGFQLSFIAVASILYFYPRLASYRLYLNINQKIKGHPLGKMILPLFLVSVSAQLGTLPFSAYYFNRIPLFSIAANLIAIPLVGLIVALGFTSVIMAPVCFWVASAYGALNQMLISGFIELFQWLGHVKYAYLSIPTPDVTQMVIYFSLILFVLHYRSPPWRKRFIFLILLCLNGWIWQSVILSDGHQLTWIQFDVGQGDAALLRFPRNRTLLIDGGQSHPFFDNGERVIAPYLRRKGIRKLDGVILSHPHNDHVGGLVYILKHFKVDQVVSAGSAFDSDLYREFLTVIETQKIPHRIVIAPDSLMDFPGLHIYFLSPSEVRNEQGVARHSEVNNQSIVTRILFGRQAWLFMGDAEWMVEERLLRSPGLRSCDVLKVGHHGSSSSSSYPFIHAVHPDFAVISVGVNNRFGHPSEDILYRFRALHTDVHRTDLEGAVVFRTDGQYTEYVDWK